jgi:hypothetical protein
MGSQWAYDKRRGKRQKLWQRAELAQVKDGSHIVSCQVTDMSAGGACLHLQTTIPLPEEFLLILSRAGKVFRHCRLVRENGLELGVKFHTPSRAVTAPLERVD